jgi:cobalt-zinc-cadmium efflux system membrane fusion protein
MKRSVLAISGPALALLFVTVLVGSDPQPDHKPSLRDALKVGNRYQFIPGGRDYSEDGRWASVLAADKDWVKVEFFGGGHHIWINLNHVGAIKTEDIAGDGSADPVLETIAAEGMITYDPTRVAHLAASVAGTVWRIERGVGQQVRKDEVVGLINAPEVGTAKLEFVQALTEAELGSKFLERLRALGEAVPSRQVVEAELTQRRLQLRVREARNALVNLGIPVRLEDFKDLAADEAAKRLHVFGLPERLLKELDPNVATTSLVPLRAPLDGEVVACDLLRGEAVGAAKTAFVIADTSRMSLSLHVPLAHARHLVVGQSVHFRPDGAAADIEGKIAWISTVVDAKTRTVLTRAELSNPNGRLRANTPGKGRIVVKKAKE